MISNVISITGLSGSSVMVCSFSAANVNAPLLSGFGGAIMFTLFSLETCHTRSLSAVPRCPLVQMDGAYDALQVSQVRKGSVQFLAHTLCYVVDEHCFWPSKHLIGSQEFDRWKAGCGKIVSEMHPCFMAHQNLSTECCIAQFLGRLKSWPLEYSMLGEGMHSVGHQLLFGPMHSHAYTRTSENDVFSAVILHDIAAGQTEDIWTPSKLQKLVLHFNTEADGIRDSAECQLKRIAFCDNLIAEILFIRITNNLNTIANAFSSRWFGQWDTDHVVNVPQLFERRFVHSRLFGGCFLIYQSIKVYQIPT